MRGAGYFQSKLKNGRRKIWNLKHINVREFEGSWTHRMRMRVEKIKLGRAKVHEKGA